MRSQIHDTWELLIVDDASSDGSAQLAMALCREDARVRLLTMATNSGGPATPRNAGLAAATGDYVCLLDQDDLWEPAKLSLQAERIESTGAEMVYSDCWIESVDGHREPYSESWGPMYEGRVDRLLIENNFVPSLTAAVARPVVARIGSFDPSLRGVDDYDYWLRVAGAGIGFACIRRPLAVWRLTGRNLSEDAHLRAAMLMRTLRKAAARDPSNADIVNARIADVRRREVARLLEVGLEPGRPAGERLGAMARAAGMARSPAEVRRVVGGLRRSVARLGSSRPRARQINAASTIASPARRRRGPRQGHR